MIARHAVSALVDQVAADMRAGETIHTLPDLALRLVSLPHSVEFLFELLMAEGRATPRDEDRCTALLLIIGAALGQIGMAIESQVAGAADTAIGLLGNLLAAAQDGELPPDLIFGLAQQFTVVGLPIPDEVRDLIAAAVGEPMDDVPVPSPEDVAADFVQVAESLGHDPFQIHEQMSEQFALFPTRPASSRSASWPNRRCRRCEKPPSAGSSIRIRRWAGRWRRFSPPRPSAASSRR